MNEPAGGETYARVAIPLPVEKGFHYRVPEQWKDCTQIGSRVRVNFGRRRLIGTVIGIDPTAEVEKVQDLQGVLSDDSRISPELLELCRWVGRQYGSSLGETLEAVLPPALRRGRVRRGTKHARLAIAAAEVAAAVEQLKPRFDKQARCLRILAESGGLLTERELLQAAKVSPAPLASLCKRGLVETFTQVIEDDPLLAGDVQPTLPPELTADQRSVVRKLVVALRSGAGRRFLLFGVTGSGKTEVYLAALDEAVRQGRQGIVLVPEISLTPQTVARFQARFPRIAVLHSALTDARRAEEWRRIRAGDVDVVVGARSAVFAPMPRLGLLVVDEEHEPSFKQQNPPRYHAREVACERARQSGALVVLGSATPSLETFAAAERGEIELTELTERVGGGSLPTVSVVDLGRLPFVRGKKAHLITDRLRVTVDQALSRGEQAILFLNRRGFSRITLCRHCREGVSCTKCDVRLVMHRQSGRLICHLCGHEISPPVQCPACGKPGMQHLGFGTERLEEELRRTFPRARMARMDSDTTHRTGSHEEILSRFGRGELDLLVGTQMIAKGLDFPRVTVVGIISADTSLVVPDYRASERTFQLVAQVAGRAGRSDLGGVVIVQTLYPDHPAIECASRHDFRSFAATELPHRRSSGYPPFSQLARLLISHPSVARTATAAARVKQKLDPAAQRLGVDLLGPAPCPISRMRDRHRYQILAKTSAPGSMLRLIEIARKEVVANQPVRVTLDVDPSSLL